MLGTKVGDFPVTEAVAARTIALPFFAALGEAQVRTVAKAIKSALTAVG
jgi:dTDP-4-amino-4,6-dideoxygalactose transaminase